MQPGAEAEAAGAAGVEVEVGHLLPLLQPLVHIQARAHVQAGAAEAEAGEAEEAEIKSY